MKCVEQLSQVKNGLLDHTWNGNEFCVSRTSLQ